MIDQDRQDRTTSYMVKYDAIPNGFKNLVWDEAKIYRYQMTDYKNNHRTGIKVRTRIEDAIEVIEKFVKAYLNMKVHTEDRVRVQYNNKYKSYTYTELKEFSKYRKLYKVKLPYVQFFKDEYRLNPIKFKKFLFTYINKKRC